LGASPVQIAGTHRVHFARKLIDETDLRMTQVALSAGFMSIRQFNHAIKGATGQTPSQLRRSRGRVETAPRQKGLIIRLPYRPPLDWPALIRFLAERATSGVEVIRDNCYQRTIETGGMAGTLSVAPDIAESRLVVCLELPDYQLLMPIVERVRRLFDLGADPLHIASGLSRDPAMKSLIELRLGLRVPGVWDGFELGVKAILGEGLMDCAPSPLLRKLVCVFGKPIETSVKGLTQLFPSPSVLMKANLEGEIGLRTDYATSIRSFAGFVSVGQLTFDAPTTLEDTVSRLFTIPNLTFSAAQYIAMRAFGEPDAFPVDGPQRDQWRPWGAYAAMHMWAVDRTIPASSENSASSPPYLPDRREQDHSRCNLGVE
jgi:AraC family transcriptional regulator of adaptative response / DNA-3-methyladenine glycosylase II